MALPHFKSDFIGTAAKGVAALGLALSPITGTASAQDAQMQQVSVSTQAECAPLVQTSTGREVNASYSAHVYSQDNVGAVGISIFPGRTLTDEAALNVGLQIAAALRQNGVQAECFVHNEHGAAGSGFNYKIDGQSWSKDGPLSIVEATNTDTLRGVVAEAKTARALLASRNDGRAPELALNR